jgi:hypothetical protein
VSSIKPNDAGDQVNGGQEVPRGGDRTIPTGDRLPTLTPSYVSYDIDSTNNSDLQPGSNLDADWGSIGDAETQRSTFATSLPLNKALKTLVRSSFWVILPEPLLSLAEAPRLRLLIAVIQGTARGSLQRSV